MDITNKRIGITGLGVVSAIGTGIDQFLENLENGRSGIGPSVLINTSTFNSHMTAEVNNFTPEMYLGKKGLREIDRSTGLLLVATQQAIADHNHDRENGNYSNAGVVIGTAFGSIHSISQFDRESLIDNPKFVNPLDFPKTVINSPASRVSIRYGMSSLNTTISTGFTSSLDAIGYSLNFLHPGICRTIFTGGVEEVCEESFRGFMKNKMLSDSQGGNLEACKPFDAERNGFILGEGAGVIIIEDIDYALANNRNIYGEIIGYGTYYNPGYNPGPRSRVNGAIKAMTKAMNNAHMTPDDIDYLCLNGNGSRRGDYIEGRAVNAVFGDSTNCAFSSIKSMTGECYGASGSLQVVATLLAIRENMIPPTPNLEKPDARCGLPNMKGVKQDRKIDIAMINSIGYNGRNSSIVIKRFHK
jgi:3-oxoacyl-[acyl-carrier-protein] synthase II